MAEGNYIRQTKVDWTSSNASSQFKLWRKEVNLNHLYIWAAAHAESLIFSKTVKTQRCKSEQQKLF
jgi:hypothetical protein